MIYIFYKYDCNDRVIIFALSYFEAKEALCSLNSYADYVYDLTEYKMYDIDMNKYCEALGIDVTLYDFPKILSENEFSKLLKCKAILDKQYKDIHNTKLLTKQLIESVNSSYTAMTTQEYKNFLKEHGQHITNLKKNIKQMLSIVGDIWYEDFYIYGSHNKYTAYGKSRYQCYKIIDELKNKYNHIFESTNKPELLIDYYTSLNQNDIERYERMINFMNKNNVRKFPFTTYKKEES